LKIDDRMSNERKPSNGAVFCEVAGALAGIGGLLLGCAGYAFEGEPAGRVMLPFGVLGIIIGPLLFAVGRMLRAWG